MDVNNLSFEKAMEGLENSAEALKSDDITLEEALSRFEEGMKYYEKCKEHLAAAGKRIQIYEKTKQELTDYSD